MKFLHTSDWHLGQLFFYQKREREHKQFLDWLLNVVKKEEIDVLLIAGDVFDTGTPGNYALKLYYDFLRKVAETCCHHVVVTGGNHDSAATLNAPKALLDAFNVHVRGAASANPSEEVLTLYDDNGEPLAIICAVPYLREGDVRRPSAGESYDEKSRAFLQGVTERYRINADEALKIQTELDKKVPVLGMGHLYTAGGVASEGVRDIFVGNLGQVPGNAFPEEFDYLALGHLHVPQKVGGAETRRYCGSPIPMSFGEANQQKMVIVGEFDQEQNLSLKSINIPSFQPLVIIEGDMDTVAKEAGSLISLDETTEFWAEIRYTGDEIIPNLKVAVEKAIGDSPVKPFVIKDINREKRRESLAAEHHETLDELSEIEVFEKCLAQAEVSDMFHDALMGAYNEILHEVLTGSEEE